MNMTKYISAILLAAMMALVLGCASTEKEKGTGEYIDDAVITTKVKAKLIEDDEVKAREIKVNTFKGKVQLTGFVKDASHKAKAVAIAKGVKGVKSVEDNIIVK